MKMVDKFKVNILSFMPNPCDCKKDNFVLKINESRNILKKRNDPSFEDLIVNLILAKATLGEESWGKEEYTIFSQSISRINDEELDVLKGTILDCLCASKIEILENLKRLADMVEFYPEVERTYIKETKTYQIKEKDISPMDCFPVIRSLFFQMRSSTAKKAKEIIENVEDVESVFEEVKKKTRSKEKEESILLEGFDKEFAYIKELPLFASLFDSYREKYFNFLSEGMYTMYENVCQKKTIIKEVEARDQQIKSIRVQKKRINAR